MEVLTVESYSGTKAEEFPLSFYINKKKIKILSIEKHWLTPEARCFKVIGDDGYSYVLEYCEADDTWRLLTVSRL